MYDVMINGIWVTIEQHGNICPTIWKRNDKK